MIAPARLCGCYDKSSEFALPQKFTNISNSIQDLEKCVCPKQSETGYEKLKGTCDISCEGNIKSNECINEDSIEEKESKVFSEIVETGLPYKETEVIINDNRMVIRVQKDLKVNNEWDPPCHCIEENGKLLKDKSRNNVIFRKVDLNHSENPCRTITVYPQPDAEVHSEPNADQSSNETETVVKKSKSKTAALSEIERRREASRKNMDLEENPNIFLLRIKKTCGNEEGKYNIDLEFRTPRPWARKPIVEKPPSTPLIESKVSVENESKKEEKKKKGKKAKTKKGGKKRKHD